MAVGSGAGFLLLFLAGFSSAPAQPAAYLPVIDATSEFDALTMLDAGRPDVLRAGKYTAPVSAEPSLLPAVYQNVNLQPLHYEFLIENFPERFAGMTYPEYLAMVGRRATRQYFIGGLYSIQTAGGGTLYGFNVYTEALRPEELLTEEETSALYQRLAETFLLRPFAYVPTDFAAIERALSWESPEFPIHFLGQGVEPEYEGYTLAENYGRVRLMTLEELARAGQEGGVSWQDIVVLDAVPPDIEGVVAGIITGERQAELSHVAVRAARRGTPNAYVQNAHELFAPYDGRLVRLAIGGSAYSVEAGVDPQEAQAWWDEHRPILPNVLTPDLTYASLDSLPEMQAGDATASLAARFGGKAAHLSGMYSILPAEHQAAGFAVPFRYYDEFMRSNSIPDGRVQPPVWRPYDEYLSSLFVDARFQSDGRYRAARLTELRDHARTYGKVDPALVEALAERVPEVFGFSDVMVRFRSSSNVEDALGFNGAGLYDSTSVCVEDTLDGDGSGPSRCDPNQDEERTIERGLKKVWTSLWNLRAYEERSYFQVPQRRAAMAILVTPAYPDEAANGVAFTGDPILGATAGYVVNVQVGDRSVVQPDTGVLPEKDILDMATGEVVAIHRARRSSLLPPGEWVLSDEQLERLGSAMALVDAGLPLDLEGHSRQDVLLDFEFKFTRTGELIFKQVRPFLRSTVPPPSQADFFQLRVPENTQLHTRGGLQLGQVLALQSRMALTPGTFYLASDREEMEADLIQEFRFGPNQQVALPRARGRFIRTTWGFPPRHNYRFEQPFEIDGKGMTVSTTGVSFREGDPPQVVNEEFLLWECGVSAATEEGQPFYFVPGALNSLTLQVLDIQLEGDRRLVLQSRIRWGLIHMATRVYLVEAEAWLPEGTLHQRDYWHLASAGNFYDGEEYWILFDTPLGDARGIGFHREGEQYRAEYLDARLEPLRALEVLSVNTQQINQTPTPTPTFGPPVTPTPTPTPPGSPFAAPNDVIVNEYWANDDGTPYETLGGRPIVGDWFELLVVRPRGVDLRGWRVTNHPTKTSGGLDDSSGSIVFPNRPELVRLPAGTVVLIVADENPSNDANFPGDDLDSADGALVFYVGNGVLDASSDPGFTIRTGNDHLAVLHPGPGPGYADDVGVDFVAEARAMTPAMFGVAGDGVEWPAPFEGIGSNDGAIFTNAPLGALDNDNGSDPDTDDARPGPGGWIVDPPKAYTGDDPGNPAQVNLLTPGAPNQGQSLPFAAPGDVNDDLRVDAGDLFFFSLHWQRPENETSFRCNPVGAELIDEEDLLWLVRQWK